MRYYFHIIVFTFLVTTASQAQKDGSDDNVQSLDIYLLIGQSNMAGRGELLPGDMHKMNHVFLLNDSNVFEPARNPLNRYSSIRKSLDMQKMGPGYQFVKSLVNSIPDMPIGLVVNARGGSSITEWQPDGTYLNELIQRAKEAQKYGTIKGVLWHQGESDQLMAKHYKKQFIRMAKCIRKSLGNNRLPFFIGELGRWRSSSADLNKVLNKLEKKRRIYLIPADMLTHKGDGTHFSRESQIELGRRYSHMILSVIYHEQTRQRTH